MAYKDKKKQREYQRAWKENRRRAFFNGKRCLQCGSIENLQLDHVDPTKKVSHKIWTWSSERRNAEVKKCQVLCTSCHKRKTKKSVEMLAHGTRGATMYRKGCRCDLCKKAQILRVYRWRRSKG